MEKTKILIETDSNTRTGFGNVSHNIAIGLANAGFDVSFLGWGFHAEGPMQRANYMLLPTAQAPFGEDVLPYYINAIKPEILLAQLDTRMGMNIPAILKQIPNHPTYIMYVVVDGSTWTYDGSDKKWPTNWLNVIKQADKVITMTKFGQDILQANGVEAQTIYHGVDTSRYTPISDENKRKLKASSGLQEDLFIFGGVFKNMQRKCPEKYLQAFKIFLEGLPEPQKDKVALLLHTNPQPGATGEFDLVEHCVDYGLQPGKNVIFSAQNVPAEMMQMVYQSMDIFMHLGPMEGFCTIGNTDIITNKGLKNIKDIKEGDYVLTHKAKYEKVSKTFKRNYKGKLIGIRRWKNHERIWLTPNHPVLMIEASKCQTSRTSCLKELCIKKQNCQNFKNCQQISDCKTIWKNAGELKPWDIVIIPRMKKHNSLKSLNLVNYIKFCNIFIKDDFIHLLGKNQFGSQQIHPLYHAIPKNLKITKEFMRFLGYYVAEGCTSETEIILCFNKNKDKKYAEDVSNFLQKLGLKASFKIIESVLEVRSHSKILAQILRNWFGTKARNKRLPEWIFEISDTMLKEFIKGFHRGDGSIFVAKTKDIGIDFTSTSKVLLHQIYMLLLRLGINSQINAARSSIQIHGIDNKNKMFQLLDLDINLIPQCLSGINVSYINNINAYFPIESIETKDYDGDVYNLGVENDNSYTTESFVVHNCMPLIEAAACGIPTIGVNSGPIGEVIGDGGILSDIPRYNKTHKISFGSYNGVECDIVDPWDIAKKMQKLYESEALRKELGFKATERAVKTFDWAIIRQQWVDLIKSLVITEDKIPEEWKRLYSETKV